MNRAIFIAIVLNLHCYMPDNRAILTSNRIQTTYYIALFAQYPAYLANGFDYPVGKPNAKGYYNAQPFGKNNHLGDDWNGNGGGNTDLGDPVYSIASGYITESDDFGGGWGNIVRIIHVWETGSQKQVVESLYAHLQKINLKKGDWVKKGDLIGTIGNAGGQYWAHLHLEIRSEPDLPIGGGYSTDTKGYLSPTLFIKKHRKL